MPRTIAIGDIHGCSQALAAVLHDIAPQSDDTIIPLGDYVDRGLDSKGVLDMLIELSKRCRLIPILGNHDECMLQAQDRREAFRTWLKIGGITTLQSYGDSDRLDLVPQAHFEFLQTCVPCYETNTHFFVHANYEPDLPLDQQTVHSLRWHSLRDSIPGPHHSGKIAVVGHTPFKEVLRLPHLIGLDTGCYRGGPLTAMDVGTGKTWQVSCSGKLEH